MGTKPKRMPKGCKEKQMNSMIRYNKNNVLDRLFAPTKELERMFSEIFNDDFFQPARWVKETSAYPMNVVNVKQDGKTVAKRLEYALAGFDKSEIKLSLKDGVLTIEAEHIPKENDDELTEYNGISYKKMSVSYSLMENADTENIKSKFNNGLLSVTIPLKKEQPVEEDESKIIDIE